MSEESKTDGNDMGAPSRCADAPRMKNITELEPRVFLQCPVEHLGAAWVQVIFFGKPTKRALDKTVEMLIEIRNDYDDE